MEIVEWKEKQRKLAQVLKPDPLIDWLGKQPPDEEYRWQDPVYCMMGRYLADHGAGWGDASYYDMPNYEQIAGQKPWTFGAALERAQELKQLPSPPLQIDGPPLLLEAPKETARELVAG